MRIELKDIGWELELSPGIRGKVAELKKVVIEKIKTTE